MLPPLGDPTLCWLALGSTQLETLAYSTHAGDGSSHDGYVKPEL